MVKEPDLEGRAAQAYAEGDRLWNASQPEAALAAFLRAIALRPEHPNAKNFAGWLLTTRHRHEPSAMAHGLALLAEAHALTPEKERPLYNLVEGLVAAGQRAQAFVFVDAAVAARPHAPQAINLRGWLRGIADGADDPKGALIDLQQAVRRYSWYGDAHFNLGRVALQLGEESLAYQSFHNALVSGNCWRKVELHLRLGELEARRGHLRRGLAHFRRGAEQDQAGSATAALLGGVQACGNALLQSGRYVLHAMDEARRSAALETRTEPDRSPPLRSLAKHALALVPELGEPAFAELRAAVEQVAACAKAAELLPQYADQSPALILELAAGSGGTPEPLRAPLRRLARHWIAAQRSLYDELIEREESSPEDPGSARARLAELAAARAWDAARVELEQLNTTDEYEMLFRAAKAEEFAGRARRDGAAAVARALYQIALRDYQQYASGASSGAEGMGRMLDVNRVRALLGEEVDDVEEVDE